MTIEKPQQFKNEKGQINDLEIARAMAEEENKLREDGEKQEAIDKEANFVGKQIHEQKMMPLIAEKINNALTEEEKEAIINHPVLFESLLHELIKAK